MWTLTPELLNFVRKLCVLSLLQPGALAQPLLLGSCQLQPIHGQI